MVSKFYFYIMPPFIHIIIKNRVCEENRFNYTIHITLYVVEQLSVYKERYLKKSYKLNVRYVYNETHTIIIEYLCYSASVFLLMYLQLLIWPVMPGSMIGNVFVPL